MKTIVVGIGNSQFADDGIGLLVAQNIKSKNLDPETMVVDASPCGLDILELIAGFDKAIIIDAVQTGKNEPGFIYRFDINQVQSPLRVFPHGMDFITSLKLGEKLGLAIPNQIIVFGIEIQKVDDLNEECTPKVRAALPFCVENIMHELNMSTVSN
jgi:hydrogenase maturation protease